MPQHTHPHRQHFLPLLLVLALLLSAIAVVLARSPKANAAEALPSPYLVGGAAAGAFAGNQILTAQANDDVVSAYEFDGNTWQKIQELHLVEELGLARQAVTAIATISADDDTAAVTLLNHSLDGQNSSDRTVVLERDAQGHWTITAELPHLGMPRASGDVIAGTVLNPDPLTDIGTVYAATRATGWQPVEVAAGTRYRLQDVDGDWLAVSTPDGDEIWHLDGGNWTLRQTIGNESGWSRFDGNHLARSTADGIETWGLTDDTWTLLSTQMLQWGFPSSYVDGDLVISTSSPRENISFGSLYRLNADNTWTLIYQDDRLESGPNYEPLTNPDWILGNETLGQLAAYPRHPSTTPTTQPPGTSTTSPSSSSTTAPPVTSTTNPSGPPPSGGVRCSGLNTLDAQGSFVPEAYWSVLPQYLDGTDATARMVATHLDCASGVLDLSTATAVLKFQDIKFTASTFSSITKTYNQTTITGTGTIAGDSTTYGYELAITNKTDNRGLTDYYKIKIYAPNQTAPTIVIKGPVRGHKITTT